MGQAMPAGVSSSPKSVFQQSGLRPGFRAFSQRGLRLLSLSGVPLGPSLQVLSEVRVGAPPLVQERCWVHRGRCSQDTHRWPASGREPVCRATAAAALHSALCRAFPSLGAVSFRCPYHVMLKRKTKDQTLLHNVSERVSQVQKPLFIILRKLS